MEHDAQPMLELRLRSGQIVSFDGRVIEVFARDGACERLHIAHLEAVRTDTADGAATLTLGAAGTRVEFAPAEAQACRRLLAAIEDARAADERLAARAAG
jgi:hypothetical protein